jgi:hypothetical protein
MFRYHSIITAFAEETLELSRGVGRRAVEKGVAVVVEDRDGGEFV